MNKTIKKKWVKALRSGNYKQGKERLRTTKTDGSSYYCCLGVLADVLGCEWIEGAEIARFKEEKQISAAIIPHRVADKIKLPAIKQDKLISMNDGAGRSFNYIASYIERYL